jgi:hypothetical protein
MASSGHTPAQLPQRVHSSLAEIPMLKNGASGGIAVIVRSVPDSG